MYIGDDRTDEDAFKVTIFFPSSPRPSSAHDYNNNTFCIFCSTRAWVSGARRWKLNQVLRDRGHGVGIVVSKVPKETSASYSLQEPSEVYILSNYQHVHMLDICCPSDHFFCFFLNYYYGRTRTGYGLLAAVGRMEEECTPGKHVVTITRRSHDMMDWLRRSKILALSR